MEPPQSARPKPPARKNNATALTSSNSHPSAHTSNLTSSLTAPPYYNGLPSMMDIDNPEDRSRRAASVLSMDDLEAAQALEGLRSGTLALISPNRPTKSVATAVFTGFGWLCNRHSTNLNNRFWTNAWNNAAIPPHHFTGPTTARATIVSADFLPSTYLLCYQRLSFCLRHVEIIFTAIQVRC